MPIANGSTVQSVPLGSVTHSLLSKNLNLHAEVFVQASLDEADGTVENEISIIQLLLSDLTWVTKGPDMCLDVTIDIDELSISDTDQVTNCIRGIKNVCLSAELWQQLGIEADELEQRSVPDQLLQFSIRLRCADIGFSRSERQKPAPILDDWSPSSAWPPKPIPVVALHRIIIQFSWRPASAESSMRNKVLDQWPPSPNEADTLDVQANFRLDKFDLLDMDTMLDDLSTLVDSHTQFQEFDLMLDSAENQPTKASTDTYVPSIHWALPNAPGDCVEFTELLDLLDASFRSILVDTSSQPRNDVLQLEMHLLQPLSTLCPSLFYPKFLEAMARRMPLTRAVMGTRFPLSLNDDSQARQKEIIRCRNEILGMPSLTDGVICLDNCTMWTSMQKGLIQTAATLRPILPSIPRTRVPSIHNLHGEALDHEVRPRARYNATLISNGLVLANTSASDDHDLLDAEVVEGKFADSVRSQHPSFDSPKYSSALKPSILFCHEPGEEQLPGSLDSSIMLDAV